MLQRRSREKHRWQWQNPYTRLSSCLWSFVDQPLHHTSSANIVDHLRYMSTADSEEITLKDSGAWEIPYHITYIITSTSFDKRNCVVKKGFNEITLRILFPFQKYSKNNIILWTSTTCIRFLYTSQCSTATNWEKTHTEQKKLGSAFDPNTYPSSIPTSEQL